MTPHVSSASHRWMRMFWGDLNMRGHYSCLLAYKQAKLANVLFTNELNRRLGLEAPVRAFAADPGLEIGQKGTAGAVNFFWPLRRRGGVSPARGAATSIFLAAPTPAFAGEQRTEIVTAKSRLEPRIHANERQLDPEFACIGVHSRLMKTVSGSVSTAALCRKTHSGPKLMDQDTEKRPHRTDGAVICLRSRIDGRFQVLGLKLAGFQEQSPCADFFHPQQCSSTCGAPRFCYNGFGEVVRLPQMPVRPLARYRGLLMNRSFMLITIGETVSQFGSRLGYIARMMLVLSLTGRALDVGTVTLLSSIPDIVFGPIAGWLADRLPRKAIAVASNTVLTVIALLFIRASTLPGIYALTFASAVVSSFFLPAKQAMVPSLVTRDELVEMNTFNVVLRNIVQIAGPAAGGLIVAVLGSRAAFLVDAGTFLFAAVMTAMVRYRQSFGDESQGSIRRNMRRDLAAGVRFVWSNVALRYVFTFEFFLTLVISMQGMLTILYVQRYIGEPVASRVGLLFSMIGIGALLGSAVTAWLLKRMGKVPLLLAALAFDGSIVLLFSQTSRFALALFFFTLLGIIGAVSGVTAGTILQEETPEEMRGRVYGLRGPLLNPVELLSIGGASLFAAWVGPRWVFFAAGLGEILLAAGGRLNRTYRKVRNR